MMKGFIIALGNIMIGSTSKANEKKKLRLRHVEILAKPREKAYEFCRERYISRESS